MSITGAGDGIMKAGHEGPQRESSFGLSIRLPFETTANEVIEGDPKLINFRYFFTRKLMFMSHADAVAVFPGGFGTQDELFETLTLVQTGKSNPVPDRAAGRRGTACTGSTGIATSARTCSRKRLDQPRGSRSLPPRHVGRGCRRARAAASTGCTTPAGTSAPNLVLRLLRPLTQEQLEQLNEEFAILIKTGRIEQSGPLEGEEDHLELPRVRFAHTRHHFGLIRAVIDRINSFGRPPEERSARSAERVRS